MLPAVSPKYEEIIPSRRSIYKSNPTSLAKISAVSVLPQPGGPQKSNRLRTLQTRGRERNEQILIHTNSSDVDENGERKDVRITVHLVCRGDETLANRFRKLCTGVLEDFTENTLAVKYYNRKTKEISTKMEENYGKRSSK